MQSLIPKENERVAKNIWKLFQDYAVTDNDLFIPSIFMEHQVDDEQNANEINMNKTQPYCKWVYTLVRKTCK